ncbi:MAG TPA: efflux RND transporter permease subunit [Thermodesulfobacteriota bacterium]|nr:efflux RND transporter permease subunit [Thermodesulfobacteriota bacterium]
MGEVFGFMACLGIARLAGVIVSRVIVLFDFIEVKHEEGEPLVESLLDAGIERLRPVLITVGATILALFPLAIDGGPLWQPLCYAQIGGLALATVIELVLVPVFYAVFVLDLGIIKWGNDRQAVISEPSAKPLCRPRNYRCPAPFSASSCSLYTGRFPRSICSRRASCRRRN